MTQPSVLMNRFIINLKTLGAAGSSQVSSARHRSRFSAPNFRIPPDSFLGNIGEDLRDGQESADDDLDSDQAVSLNIQDPYEAESAEARRGTSSSRSINAQVSADSSLRTKATRDNIVSPRPVP